MPRSTCPVRRASLLGSLAILGLVLSPTHGQDAAADPAPKNNESAPSAAADGVDLAKDDWQTRLDPAVIYRYDPVKERLLPIPAAELKPGHVYLRHVPRLGRHAWSLADDDRRLRYAMGPGSVQPARQFDLRVSEAERQREFEARAPELARRLAILGARPTVRLDADGHWQLQQNPGLVHVFDLETGARWEWHGDRRTPVIHSGGNAWALVGGTGQAAAGRQAVRYRPASTRFAGW